MPLRHAPEWIAVLAATVALSAAPAEAQLQAQPVASGFSAPVAFVQDPSDPTVQVVVEQGGRIRLLKNGVVQAQDYLDLTGVVECCGERGLLGFAFAPNYATTGRVYVNYTRRPDGHTVVARFRRHVLDPLRADPATRFDFIWPGGLNHIVQPFANHNGGHMAFGPDGFLYIGLGDGGSGNDPMHLAQNPLSLLGKMLRLDASVSDADPQGYDVPASNPFAGQPGVLGEIWAFGLRNPWRWSFDLPAHGGTGAMLIADVGQSAWEEVNHEPAGRGGRNYGWRNREGAHTNVTSLPPFSTPLTDPIHEYSHAVGRSITGGFVYRGTALGSAFRGQYFFADFITSRIWSLELNLQGSGEATAGTLIEHTGQLGLGAFNPSSFGIDAGGEIYLVAYSLGAILRLTGPPLPPPGPPPPPPPPPAIAQSDTDFDDDDRPDLVWQHEQGFLHVWFMDGHVRKSGAYLTPLRVDPDWQIADADDFDGDGQADLLWQHQPTGTLYLWLMNGTALAAGVPLSPGAIESGWRIGATGDFDRDGKTDILWQDTSTGSLVVWLMDGAVRQSVVSIAPGPAGAEWRVAGTGDFNQDGHIDIVFQHTGHGDLSVWLMNGTTLGEVGLVTPASQDPLRRVVAVADFDGDSHADLVWQHQTSGQLSIWYLNGLSQTRSESLTPSVVDSAWRIVGGK